MSQTTEARLKTLGLWPVWRLRAGGNEDPAEVGVQVAEAAPAAEPAQPARRPAEPGRGDEPGAVGALDWDALRAAVAACTRCPLHETRTKPVFGVGDPAAELLIIGEAPGADEDRQGEPFVGQAGRLLDAMLAAIGQKRGRNVYIANVLKSRPPGNRDPRQEEVAACIPYLERQIDLIRPKIILALGRFAAQSLLLTEASISRLRGRVHHYRGVALVVTYHPAYLLRNPADKAKVWEDLCLARNVLSSSLKEQKTGD
ncbi:uracil-DNA glycosylase [Parasulfuritortus cantonensis]|uniref:Type-4 uracil-DNA glycosylase n=1 Tax=Parasulfuritortus cantonensis TaxID=2528202 RepID=A0A4R1BMC1_9PROT|nr:uracil-DNA glycosylase [Parasulfuritortus cantonensis]TCJ18496.1 uracil-DNA glycosylase [Parasulfuritortus cantonensis]